METVMDKIYLQAIQYAMSFAAALVIFLIGKWAARMASNVVENLMQKSKINKTLISFSKNMVYFSVMTFVVIAALNKVGVETNSFLAIIGAAGLAVGLALQGSLANFAAGVMLIIFHPFQVGDLIEAGGAMGTVNEIQIFSTIMITADKKKVIVPNAKITADKIVIHLSA